jgi:site-specific DNA-methyltransferase (adenine-specific)
MPKVETIAEGIVLHLGDCREILPTLGRVDHVITDPPFTQRTSENMRSRRDRKDGGAYLGGEGRRRIEFDGVDGMEPWIAEASLAASRRWVLIFCALEQIGVYASAAGDSYVRGTAWRRTNPAPQYTGDRPGQAHEGAVLLHNPGRKKWNRGGCTLAWEGPTINSVADPDRGLAHPTPKPAWLMIDAIDALTLPGELVCDPFMGSGTTGVAAIRVGRQFVGIERDQNYFDLSCKRVSAALQQQDLFVAKPKPAEQLGWNDMWKKPFATSNAND